jgi:hypothetical protein
MMTCCDLCNVDIKQTELTIMDAKEMRQVAANGFGPWMDGIRGIDDWLDDTGFFPAELDGAWRMFVSVDTTSWALCATCVSKAKPFLSRNRRDTRRRRAGISAPRPPESWSPGAGKLRTIKQALINVNEPASTRTADCDICNSEIASSQLKIIDRATMRLAIQRGLDPWRTPGIDPRPPMLLGPKSVGMSEEERYMQDVYLPWRDKSVADLSDWRACEQCERAVLSVIQPKPEGAVLSVIRPKPWYKFW